jgi:hypothetical protein
MSRARTALFGLAAALAALFTWAHRPTPTPPAPTPPPAIAAGAPAELLLAANAMRSARGLPAFAWDGRLAASARGHALDLAAGRARPHDGLAGRIAASGFPVSSACRVSRPTMPVNYTEGIEWGSQPASAASLAALVAAGPGEGHYDDFYDPKIALVGIGVASGGGATYTVLDYGIDCGR